MNTCCNHPEIITKLREGNQKYLSAAHGSGDISPEIRRQTAADGQKPFAAVVTCSDSRVLPEAVFSAGIGELFVIREAGNVVGPYQLGSIDYALSHLGVKTVLVLGHTHCGAVGAALAGGGDGLIKPITEEIAQAVGSETDDFRAAMRNARHSAEKIRTELTAAGRDLSDTDILAAVYDIESGEVRWDGEQ